MNDAFEPENLSDLIDERLSESDAESVRRRLIKRPDEAVVLGELLATRKRLRSLPRLEPHPGLARQIMQQIANEETRRRHEEKRSQPDFVPVDSEPVRSAWVSTGREPAHRHFSLAGLRAIAGVLSMAAVVLIALVVFPRLGDRTPESIVQRPGSTPPFAAGSSAEGTGDSSGLESKVNPGSNSNAPLSVPRSSDSLALENGNEDVNLPGRAAEKSESNSSLARGVASDSSRNGLSEMSGNHVVDGQPDGGQQPSANQGIVDRGPTLGFPGGATLPAAPETRRQTAGAEFLIVVHLPAMREPTQQWIESVFRQAERRNEDPNFDPFAASLAEHQASRGNVDSGQPSSPADSPPLQDLYFVRANANLLRLIVDRMPSATFECNSIDQVGMPDAHNAASSCFNRVEPKQGRIQPQQGSNAAGRADQIFASLEIDPFSVREYGFLFEFRFGE